MKAELGIAETQGGDLIVEARLPQQGRSRKKFQDLGAGGGDAIVLRVEKAPPRTPISFSRSSGLRYVPSKDGGTTRLMVLFPDPLGPANIRRRGVVMGCARACRP